MISSLWQGNKVKRIIVSLIVLNIIALLIYGATARMRAFSAQIRAAYNPRLAKAFVKLGVMSKEDYQKYCLL